MDLSKHEARILQELEDDLAMADPRLNKALNTGVVPALPARMALLAGTALAAGIALMVWGIALRSVALGALAFAIMTAAPIPFTSPSRWFAVLRARTIQRKQSAARDNP